MIVDHCNGPIDERVSDVVDNGGLDCSDLSAVTGVTSTLRGSGHGR